MFMVFFGVAIILITAACEERIVNPASIKNPEDVSEDRLRPLPAGFKVIQQDTEVNITLLIGEEGILLVDTGWPDRSQALADSVRAFSNAEVERIINSHVHADHIGGNGILSAGGTLLGHINQRTLFQASNLGAVFQSVADSVSLNFNGQHIQCFDMSNAHTNSDIIVYFPDVKVLCLGDLYLPDSYPSVDTRSGGSVQNLLKTYDRLLTLFSEDVLIVPGHHSLTSKETFRNYVNRVKGMVDAVRGFIDQGNTLDDLLYYRDDILGVWKNNSSIVPELYWLISIYNSYYASDN